MWVRTTVCFWHLCGRLFFFLFSFSCCLSSLAVSACRRGAPALAPNQLPSCVHSALPQAAGKLVAAICHKVPLNLLSCGQLFMSLRKASVCTLCFVCVCVHCCELIPCRKQKRKLGINLNSNLVQIQKKKKILLRFISQLIFLLIDIFVQCIMFTPFIESTFCHF